MHALCSLLVALVPAADPSPTEDHGANPVLTELREQGVVLTSVDTYMFPGPLMEDGLSAAEQRKLLQDLCRRKGVPFDGLFARHAAAPYALETREVKSKGTDAKIYVTDIWFVTYGNLKALAKKDPVQLFGGNPAQAQVTPLDDEDLTQRKIALDLKPPLRERYINTTADLLDTVKISSTSYAVCSESPRSMVVASRVDPRFEKDATYPNRWEMLPFGIKANPKAPRGPQPMSGGGLYLKITLLDEKPGALFVEIHQVSTEPKAWFNGGQALRGKVPAWVNSQVRDFMNTALKTAP